MLVLQLSNDIVVFWFPVNIEKITSQSVAVVAGLIICCNRELSDKVASIIKKLEVRWTSFLWNKEMNHGNEAIKGKLCCQEHVAYRKWESRFY